MLTHTKRDGNPQIRAIECKGSTTFEGGMITSHTPALLHLGNEPNSHLPNQAMLS